jgi:hypothetical protein
MASVVSAGSCVHARGESACVRIANAEPRSSVALYSLTAHAVPSVSSAPVRHRWVRTAAHGSMSAASRSRCANVTRSSRAR